MTARNSADAESRLRASLSAELDLWRGSKVIVAVSGGSDSVALLRVLASLASDYELRLTAAHLNHGVRGAAAAEDARFVRELSSTLDVSYEEGAWAPSRAGHFESDARRTRYRWLTEIATARGAGLVATGHTRDDQAETILHRVLRGTGMRGLAGIPSRRPLSSAVTLVRPLLGVSRATLRAYLAQIGQDYREDETNADLSRTRARIRQDLLPKLAAEYNPRVIEALVRLGGLARETDRTMQRLVRRLERTARIADTGSVVMFDRRMLGSVDSHMRIEMLRRAWQDRHWPEAGMSAARWARLAQVAAGEREGRFAVSAGIALVVGPDTVALAPAAPDSVGSISCAVPLAIPGVAVWGAGRVIARVQAGDGGDERIDLSSIEPPLTVRAAQPGDRFEPLGMGNQTQPLNDFFRGRGVCRAARAEVPLVCDRHGIVWVVGHRIAHRVRRTDTTQAILSLSWETS